MSKVLLVEPDKMLRQAFMVALIPEFQIQVVDALPDAAPKDVDALIVDAAALLEQEPESAPRISAVAEWQLPIIWIDADQSKPAANPAHCTRLNRPVAKETLRRALARCFIATVTAKTDDGLSAQAAKAAPRPKRKSQNAAHNPTGDSRNFIELVDVVEEEAAR